MMMRFMLTAALCAASLPTVQAAPPDSKTIARYFAAVRGLEDSLSRPGSSDLAAWTKALRTAVLAVRDEGRHQPSCLRVIDSASWTLSKQAAESAPRAEMAAELQKLWSGSDDCRLTAEAPVTSLAEADWAVTHAETVLRGLEQTRVHAERCSAKVSVDGLVEDLAAGKFGVSELERIKSTVGEPIMHYYQHRVFAEGSPAGCSRLKGVETLFVRKSEILAKSGGWGCDDWYNEKAFTQALVARSPNFDSVCRSYIAQGYPHMTKDDVASICGAFSGNLEDSKKICSGLIPRYLAPGKMGACVSEFDRYKLTGDESACKSLESWPGPWLERCYDYAAFTRATKAKDPALCKDNELCHLYMGDWMTAFAPKYEAEIGAKYCTAMGRTMAVEKLGAVTLLERGGDYLAAAGGGAPVKALREKTARLRARFVQLPDLQTSTIGSQSVGAHN